MSSGVQQTVVNEAIDRNGDDVSWLVFMECDAIFENFL